MTDADLVGEEGDEDFFCENYNYNHNSNSYKNNKSRFISLLKDFALETGGGSAVGPNDAQVKQFKSVIN